MALRVNSPRGRSIRLLSIWPGRATTTRRRKYARLPPRLPVKARQDPSDHGVADAAHRERQKVA